MAEALESGVLLTWDGDGHTAYGSTAWTRVDAYLVEGTCRKTGPLAPWEPRQIDKPGKLP